jgi:hypothetical protein
MVKFNKKSFQSRVIKIVSKSSVINERVRVEQILI